MITLNLPDYCQDCPFMELQAFCERAGLNQYHYHTTCKNADVCERMYNLLRENQQKYDRCGLCKKIQELAKKQRGFQE